MKNVEFMRQSIVFCSSCTMLSLNKFPFAISSADELLVHINKHNITVLHTVGSNTVIFAVSKA